MFIALCAMGAVIVLLAAVVVRAAYVNSELRDMVDSMKDRPSLDGLSDYSKRLVTDYAKNRRLHDGTRHKASQRAKTRPYEGQWE